MGKFRDLTGQKFGRLTPISKVRMPNNRIGWNCICDCGKSKNIDSSSLISEKTQSCGCLHKEIIAENSLTHNMSKGRLYSIWISMKKRCYNPNSEDYKYYGGRGIKICKEWKLDFMNFYTWANLNGYKDNLTIDRIDSNGDYCPENCQWITKSENSRKAHNRYITFMDKTMNLVEWTNYTGLPENVIQQRLNKYGWSVENALTTKAKKRTIKK